MEEKKVSQSLQDRFNAITEKKTPGSTNTEEMPVNEWWKASEDDFDNSIKSKETETNTGTKENTKKKTKEKEKETEEGEEEEPEEEEKESEEEETGTKKKPGKITDKIKRGSAIAATDSLQILIRMVAVPLINMQYKKKFTKDEINNLDRVIDTEIDDLQDEDLILRKKFEKAMLKREKKLGKVEFEPSRKDNLETSMYNYFDYTETAMSPGWYAAFAICNAVGGTIIDIIQE